MHPNCASSDRLAKSLTGEETAAELFELLCLTLKLKRGNVAAAMRDKAGANTVCIEKISSYFTYLKDIGCIAHSVDKVRAAVVVPPTAAASARRLI